MYIIVGSSSGVHPIEIGESNPPILTDLDPADTETDVSVTTDVALSILDLDSGVAFNTVILRIQGVIVWQSDSAQAGYSGTRTTVTNGYRYTLNPPGAFGYLTTITVDVYAEDFFGNVLDTSYYFVTENSTSVLLGLKTHVATNQVDNIRLEAPSLSPQVVNRIPSPIGLIVDTLAIVKETTRISFDIVEMTAAALTRCDVYVTYDSTETLVYTGPDTHPSYFLHANWNLIEEFAKSPSAISDDIWRISLGLSNGLLFTSSDLITVRIVAQGSGTQTFSHSFYIRDYDRPGIVSITPSSDGRKLRIRFDEAMDTLSGSTTSIYYSRNISGRLEFFSKIILNTVEYTNVLRAPLANFTSDDEGYFVGIYGALNASNNTNVQIVTRIDHEYVVVDKNLVDEEVMDLMAHNAVSAILCPYRVRYVSDGVVPAYCPMVLEAYVPDAEFRGLDDGNLWVELRLVDNLTVNRDYILDVVKVTDLAGNEIGSSHDFHSQLNTYPEDRDWDLWSSSIPDKHKREDYQHDLEKFIRCIQEASHAMLEEVDAFGQSFDATTCKETVVPILLNHLGNPYAFVNSFTATAQRDLIQVLVASYRKKGSPESIERLVLFLLGKAVTVEPWTVPTSTWLLGESELGFDTWLGPSQRKILYSFSIHHEDSLSDREKAIITEIAMKNKPAHTHFVSFVYDGP